LEISLGFYPLEHESDVTTHTLTASTAGSPHSSIKVTSFNNPNVDSSPAWSCCGGDAAVLSDSHVAFEILDC
jgi:hypothetical protein